MSREEQRDLSRRSLGLWSSSSTDRLEDLVAPAYINHQEPYAEGGERVVGLKNWRAILEAYHRAFSDSQVTILTQISEGPLVAVHWEFTAQHTGEYLGQEATGKVATWKGMTIDRFEGGKIAETWTVWERYELLKQLGFVSEPA
ncbi:MAG: ester cyclase [Pseudomonadota bacterium]